MTTPTQQKLTNAYNEFIRDYVEAHGQNQATRDEAHEIAGRCVSLGQLAVDLGTRAKLSPESIDWMIEAIKEVGPEEAYLVACAVAVALEEGK